MTRGECVDPNGMYSSRSDRRLVALSQELEKLHAFAQAALHHLRRAQHLADNGGDLRRAEIEPLVEALNRVEYLGVAEMRIAELRDLATQLIDQRGVVGGEPAVVHRLLVQEGPRIRRRERHLDGMRVDFGGEADGLLDGFLGLSRQAEDEGTVDDDAE